MSVGNPQPDLTPKTKAEAVSFEGTSWILPTTFEILDGAGKALVDRLGEAGWDRESDEVYFMQLAVHEALINAVAHGNLGLTKPEGVDLGVLVKEKLASSPTKKRVYVTIEATQDRVTIKIRDEGDGFKKKEVPDPTLPEGQFKDKGRGLLFMEQGFDSITYNEKGNEVVLVKNRKE